ncbi:MAG: SpoIID/LytB domain-containing protein [Blastocatellia bacterium]|nr:SpoIID/LytB domain-containing protein [Blastocatellia bacterium]
MTGIKSEPSIRVGLVTGARAARVTLQGRFTDANGKSFTEGDYTATAENGAITLYGERQVRAHSLRFSAEDFDACRFTVHDVTIGIDFHWERKESQSFQGTLELRAGEEGLIVINELPLEAYLVSVISSEMSASCPAELLRAHAIVARGWLLAQLRGSRVAGEQGSRGAGERGFEHSNASTIHHASRVTPAEIIRWYDRENHAEFDVCADDHCQRYQGISKAFSQAAFDAVRETRGKALMSEGEICDARYSKSCGGMTEVYSAAWEDRDVPYLASIYDGAGEPTGYSMPLTVESNAEVWITSSPEAYCNAASGELLARILTGFDQETQDFYRWEVSYSGDELSEIIEARLGLGLGRIIALEPLERGRSGRIIRLRISGEKESVIIGKELEIRRALARSHLYSSAFVVRSEQYPETGFIECVRLVGAGWGHGVGMCQIGAAVMADLGRGHEEILAHYFLNAKLSALY